MGADGFTDRLNDHFFAEATEKAAESADIRADKLVKWMIDEYNLGQMPSVRRKMYERVARTVVRSEELMSVFVSVVQLAREAKNPGRYFSRAITVRLAEVLNKNLMTRFGPPQK